MSVSRWHRIRERAYGRFWPALFLILCLVAGGLASVHFGQDADWDLKNYHLYNAWSFDNARLHKDLFAAGIQTYFAPVVEMPYYLLSMGPLNDHPRLLAFVMGLPYGLLVFLSFEICEVVARRSIEDQRIRVLLSVAATAFGASGIALVSQIGMTTNEIPTAALVVAGLWLLLLHAERPFVWNSRALYLVFVSGLLFGSAAGLKLTAAVYAPGAGLCCLLLPGAFRRRLARAFVFSIAWIAAVLVLWGPWGAKLYNLTGNPLFPMFNDVFQSSWLPLTGGRDLRYMPSGLFQAIAYPFYWILPNTTVNETTFADPRFAAVYVSAVILLLLGAAEWLRKKQGAGLKTEASDGSYSSRLLIMYVAVTFAIWEAEFSILRYAAALESISGAVVLIAVASRFRSKHLPAMVKHGTAIFLVAMAVGATALSVYPWRETIPFGDKVWNVQSPSLKAGSTVLLADPPMAFVAPFISRSNQNISFVGMPSYLESTELKDAKIGALVRQRIATAHNLYAVYYQSSVPPLAELEDYGAKIDFQSCREITSNVSSALSICDAVKIPLQPLSKAPLFSLEPTQIGSSDAIGVTISFAKECTANPSSQIADIHYSARKPLDGVRVYVQTLPEPRVFLGEGPSSGTMKTGPWATGGQNYIFTDNAGNILAHYRLRFVACD